MLQSKPMALPTAGNNCTKPVFALGPGQFILLAHVYFSAVQMGHVYVLVSLIFVGGGVKHNHSDCLNGVD